MFRQDRTNPSTAVSNWRGRHDSAKGWPSTAVSSWLNGGLFGSNVWGYSTTGSPDDTVVDIGGTDYRILRWTGSGTLTIEGNPDEITAQVLVVAGGGGGGTKNGHGTGGGGGGGMRQETSMALPAAVATITVGTGGSGGMVSSTAQPNYSGGDSSIVWAGGITLAGTGGGKGQTDMGPPAPDTGGSGGGGGAGGAGAAGNAGSYSPAEGHAGGAASNAWGVTGGGGGGSYGVGNSGNGYNSGSGGQALTDTTYTGSAIYYGGGGSGQGYGPSNIPAVSPGGGTGSNSPYLNTCIGTDGTGGGGGAGGGTGSATTYNTDGGNGVVIFRWVDQV
jgi:hypothetical protein